MIWKICRNSKLYIYIHILHLTYHHVSDVHVLSHYINFQRKQNMFTKADAVFDMPNLKLSIKVLIKEVFRDF